MTPLCLPCVTIGHRPFVSQLASFPADKEIWTFIGNWSSTSNRVHIQQNQLQWLFNKTKHGRCDYLTCKAASCDSLTNFIQHYIACKVASYNCLTNLSTWQCFKAREHQLVPSTDLHLIPQKSKIYIYFTTLNTGNLKILLWSNKCNHRPSE